MSEQALVSIIIPTYNRAHLIGETLDSILAQTYKNWECIVVDDGSTDKTFTELEKYSKKYNQIKTFVRSNEYQAGGNGARNMGLDLSNCQWVMFLDSDDLLLENCIENRLKELNNETNMLISLTGTFKKKLGDDNAIWNIINKNESNIALITRFINNDMPFHTNGVLWDKAFLDRIGKWNESLKSWQDWELHIRALFCNPKINCSRVVDNYYRKNVENSIASQKYSWTYIKSVMNAIKSIETFIINDNNFIFNKDLKFLIIRSLISYPIKLGNTFTPIKLLFRHYRLRSMSRLMFLKYYLLEMISKFPYGKYFAIKVLKLSYLKLIYKDNTFLKLTQKDI